MNLNIIKNIGGKKVGNSGDSQIKFENDSYYPKSLNSHKSPKSPNPTGFTFVELLIVSTLMMFMLAMAAPFTTAMQSEISMKKTVQQIKTNVITTMGYSLAGKSLTNASNNDLMDASLIPSRYALYFQKNDTWGDQYPYRYLEMTTEVKTDGSQNTKVSYNHEKELPTSTVYISDIRLIQNDGNEVSVNSSFIIFTPPFSKINFFPNQDPATFNKDIRQVIKDNDKYDSIEIDLMYKDELISLTTLKFGKDKILNTDFMGNEYLN